MSSIISIKTILPDTPEPKRLTELFLNILHGYKATNTLGVISVPTSKDTQMPEATTGHHRTAVAYIDAEEDGAMI